VGVDLRRGRGRIQTVRARCAALFVIPVAIAVLAPGSLGDQRGSACASAVCVTTRIPGPITIVAGRTALRIGRDGRVERVRPAPQPFPRDGAWFPGTDTWYAIRAGHLVVGRGRKALWRSRELFAGRDRPGVVAAGPSGVAYQHDHKLYVAALGGAERPVARRELPLGWTAGGLYTYSYGRRALLLRSDSGGLVQVLARLAPSSNYAVAGGTLYFIDRGVLSSARGAQTRRLASLRALGLAATAWMQPLGPLVELQDQRRLVVVRDDGSLFASIPLPRIDGHAENISSSLETASRATAVAFTAAYGHGADPNAGRGPRGTETVYVLRAGGRGAQALHTERLQFAVCERGADVQWRGRWLLYGNSEGHVAVIDSTGRHRAIELTSVARRLAGARSGLSAYWSGGRS
jgi:hypothetical protein